MKYNTKCRVLFAGAQIVVTLFATANSVLGGGSLPSVFTSLDKLKEVIEKINKNYDSGTGDKKYLKL